MKIVKKKKKNHVTNNVVLRDNRL